MSFQKAARRAYSSVNKFNEVFIVSAARTPVGSFKGCLSSVSATQLGSIAAKGAIEKAKIKPELIEEVYMGNVVTASLGQAPARQAAIGAGLPVSTSCTTINKVCASGMKAIMLATQNLQLGIRTTMLAGGMESMSNAPFYLKRGSLGYGHQTVEDSIVKDGLWDVYNNIHMGTCAEHCAEEYKISRHDQDEYAIKSYMLADKAWKNGLFNNEVVPVTVKDRKKEVVISEDEEYKKANFDRIRNLKSAFSKGGTVTAANASTLNDGASAVVLMTGNKVKELGLKPLAKIISYADAECAPMDYTIAPSKAIPIALSRAGLSTSDISLFEINEAFSVVALVNEKILKLNPNLVNIAGGGVSLGHPIGSSGARIVVSLANLLKPGQFGCAAVCNGGGGASSMVIQRL